ncbi:MAG TPA: molybdopterin-dependent oxidoreductase [Candidatus Binatia bacterium]
MAVESTRRGFLQGAGALILSLTRLGLRDAVAAMPDGASASNPSAALPEYRGWEDLYRQRWVWDKVAKGTHHVNCWYQRGCNWNVYVKDGVVFREEQAATYVQTNSDVPDFNPRGCQKGACYSQRIYDAARLHYPLKRAGARGEGKWTRVSWKQALREIADKTIDAMREDGPGSITWDPGGGNTHGCRGIGLYRTGYVLDTPIIDVNGEVGDHHPGAYATLGKISCASSADDLFYSDLILVWGGNPTYTQIPNAHFIIEARYRGARVVAIAPDYNASAIHADRWISVDVASDAAFGLALAHVMVEEGIYDAPFVKEQTDLPLLVRTDTHTFLRGRDLQKGGDEDTFYVFDRTTNAIREASKKALSLEGVDPALEGEFRVNGTAGEITVTPVFSLLRKHLAAYSPQAMANRTGVHPQMMQTLAREIARAKAATIITQSNFSKFYHGLEMERAQILVLALAGQIGKKGSGINVFPALDVAGIASANFSPGSVSPKKGAALIDAAMAHAFIRNREQGLTDEMTIYQLAREEYRKGGHVSGMLFLYFQGGLDQIYGASARWDPTMKRELKDYLAESLQKGWQIAPAKARPRIFFEAGGNFLRRTRGYDRLYTTFLPKLDLLVTIDWRMSNTALHSDYVLPAATWYEKDDITWATPIAPFAHVTTRAAAPVAESKTDWEFHCLLLKEIQKRAKERGLTAFVDRAGQERRLDQVYDEFTFGGRYREDNPEELLDELLSFTTNLGNIRWNDLKEKGFARFTGLGADYLNIGNATDIKPDETITANTWHTEKKQPWPTLTRRIQFYIDHPFYLELGEALPTHKDSPKIGGDYPLQLTSQHARWSIHASWRDDARLLRLQRGAPVITLSVMDAKARGLTDGDRARVRNDIGSFEVEVKVSGAVHPGQVIINHAWEPYQFKGGRSHDVVAPSPINPLQIAGGYFHLQPAPYMGSAGGVDRGTRIEVERLGSDSR